MGRSIHSKPAVSAWLIRERKRLGLKPRDVAERLTARGLPVQEGTVRTWEAGRNPSPENIEGLEAIFESRSPESSGGGDTTTPGLSELLVRLDQLIDQNAQLIRMLSESRTPPVVPPQPAETGPEARRVLTRSAARAGNVEPPAQGRSAEPTPIQSARTGS